MLPRVPTHPPRLFPPAEMTPYRPMHLSRAFLVVALLSLMSAACGGSEEGNGPRRGTTDAPIPSVEIVQARMGALPLEERLSGTVRAENQVAIFPEIAAPVERVVANDGDYVRQGQPLIYLRDTQYREQLRQAEANLQINQAEARRAEATLRELQSRLARTRELAEKQFQSQQELEMLEAQVDAAEATHQQALGRIALAQANVEEQQEALRRTVVRAPISGYVGQRDVEVGMRVDTGTQLFTIGNLSRVRVQVSIPDGQIGRIRTGQTALITSENLGERVLRAEVSRISPFLQSGSYSAAAEIDVDNREGLLSPGMFVAVDVQYGESEQATLVPVSALYEHPSTGVLGVYVATTLGTEMPVEIPDTYDPEAPPPLSEPTPMTFREVTVLARGRETVGLDGIRPGDWIVTVGQNLLSAAASDRPEARARVIPWDRLADLQRLQDQDLLRVFMEKQQRIARRQLDEASGRATGAADSAAPPATRTSTAP